MKDQGWTNPNTGETFVHREREGRRELLFGIYGNQGGNHGHAVWNNDRLAFLRERDGRVVADDRLR